MKRFLIFALTVACIGTVAFAQVSGAGPQGTAPTPPKSVTIEGKLAFIDHEPAVVTKDKTYLIKMPRFYYYAYTDGMKEGSAVKVEGFELPSWPGQEKPVFHVVKATIAGKVYDFSAFVGQFGRGHGRSGGDCTGCPSKSMGGGMGMKGGRF